MKSKILLLVIYCAFISLGLPDGALGVAWPEMREEYQQPIYIAGYLTLILTICSAISSFLNGKLVELMGVGKIVFISCILTGSSLMFFYISPAFIFIVLLIIPLGFGQGAVDSSLNNYVANNYSSMHMNWLHSFWGIGASIGPFIITMSIAYKNSWKLGYLYLGIIQLSIGILLLVTLNFWKSSDRSEHKIENTNNKNLSKINSLNSILAILLFFIYAGVEFSVGLWSYSIFVESRNISKSIAGFWTTSFYISITIGRFLFGIVVNNLGNRLITRLGMIISIIGTVMVFTNLNAYFNLFGIILIGFGFAPIYPCMMHEIPKRFDAKTTRTIIGFLVGSAMIGSSILPLLTGYLISSTSLEFLYPVVFCILILLLSISEWQNKIS
ncbi:MAG: MFS transporter [Clostridiales bacterium]